MIQFNLLPDVKLEYIKAKRQKRLVVMTAAIVAGSSFAIMALLFVGVSVVQKKALTDLSKDIAQSSKKLKEVKDLDKMLTVQNQMISLPRLNDQKPVVSRLLPYVQEVTPKDVSISKFQVDYEAKTMEIEGSTNALSTVNKFVDTLKFTDFVASQANQAQPKKRAFSSVVLASFSQSKDNKGTSYKITLSFDPLIFDSTYNVDLTVPAGLVTTRSATDRPTFEVQPQTGNTTQEQQ